MPWSVTVAGQKPGLLAARFCASLERDPLFYFDLDSKISQLTAGSPISVLDNQDVLFSDLVAMGLQTVDQNARSPVPTSRLVASRPIPAEWALGSTHRVYQRRNGESLSEFLNRWLRGPVVSASGEDGDLESLANALVPGTCLLQPPGGGAQFRRTKARSVLSHQSCAFVGWSRLLGSECRARFFNPSAGDNNWFVPLQPKSWPLRASPQSDAPLMTWHEATFVLTAKAMSDFLRDLPRIRRYAIGETEFPCLPSTVKLGESWLFCRDVHLEFSLSTPSEQANVTVALCLSTQRPFIGTDPCPTTFRSVGRFEKWTDDGRRIEILPPTAEQLKASTFPSAPTWELDGKQPLLTNLLSPGFAREKYSAMYTRLETGDLLAIEVPDGGTPVALGAVQMRRMEFESQGAPSLSFSASALMAQAIGPSGEPNGTFVAVTSDGVAEISGKKKLELQKQVSITQDKSEFRKDVAIKGNLDIS